MYEKSAQTLCIKDKCSNYNGKVDLTRLFCDKCFKEKTKIENMMKTLESIKEQIDFIRDAILYAPGGVKAQEGEARWNSRPPQ